jgi:hypothetical protein
VKQQRIVPLLIHALILAPAISACSNPNGGPIPLESYATEYARAACATSDRCGTGYFVAFLTQEQITNCTTQMAQFLESNLVAQLKTSIAAGRIAYDGAKARACIEAAAESECGASLTAEDCLDTFQGLIPDGGACTTDEECAATSRCSGADGCTAGTCVHVPQRGEACTVECSEDAFCDGDSDICLARLSNGAACTSEVQCESISCVDGVCTARTRPGEGEACVSSCASNLVCAANDEGMRVCRAPRTDGTCTAPQDCPPDQLCQEGGTCGPYPIAGQPCSYACASGSRCIEGTCLAIIETGSACERNGECRTYHCDAGTCASAFVCE